MQQKITNALFALVILLVLSWWGRETLLKTYEATTFKLFPTVERALSYGSRHLDSGHSGSYDIGTAEYYFLKAAEIDPTYPYVFHQLARVSFLKNELSKAKAQIDYEISNHPEHQWNVYYLRGLIEGYQGNYADSAKSYEIYLKHDTKNWAAINDLSWVLLKDNRPQEALNALNWGLMSWPKNPWLLNSKVVALEDLGRTQKALETSRDALRAVMTIAPQEWSHAYPGNDPLIAPEGVLSLQESVRANMHSLVLKTK